MTLLLRQDAANRLGIHFAKLERLRQSGLIPEAVNNAVANLAPIPDGLTDEQAAYCTDMLSTGFVAAEHANIPIGGSVAIFSQGPVGLMATAGARLRGAGLVIGVESVANRIALARKYGCDAIVDFTKEDPVEAILKLTNGKGVDSAIEALGSAGTFASSVRVTRPGAGRAFP